MGAVKKMLASARVKTPETAFCGIELCETVHFHMADYRFELTVEQFDAFAKTVAEAHEQWIKMGKPKVAEFISLAHRWLPDDNMVYPNRLDVEEQTIPAIHIHLRGLSTRWTIPDFKQYAKVIEEADKALG